MNVKQLIFSPEPALLRPIGQHVATTTRKLLCSAAWISDVSLQK